MLGASRSHFWGFENRHRSHQRGSSHHRLSTSHWDVCSSHAEAVDVVGDVVDSLHDAVGVHVLVGTTGNSKGILGLSLGRVDVLVAETKLTKLILCVELAGGSCKGGREWGRGRGKPQRLRGKGNRFRGKGNRLRCRGKDRLRGKDRSRSRYKGKGGRLRDGCKGSRNLDRGKRSRLDERSMVDQGSRWWQVSRVGPQM